MFSKLPGSHNRRLTEAAVVEKGTPGVVLDRENVQGAADGEEHPYDGLESFRRVPCQLGQHVVGGGPG